MGLDSPSGGHLSHGYCTPNGKKVSSASIFFETFPYKVKPQTRYIDYDKLEEKAVDFRPKLLICGGNSYPRPREWDYAKLRIIADRCGLFLMCDLAHISGLVAAKECARPFDFCDFVTSTTNKGLRGPRRGIIFNRKGANLRRRGMLLGHGDDSNQYDFEKKINFAVFPSLQGGPHNNHVAALSIALKQVATPEYKVYIQQVKKNAQSLASALLRRKCRLVTGGTDNHLLLWDLTALGLTFIYFCLGKNYEKVCEMCYITINISAIFGDKGAISRGGVRIGTPAMTTKRLPRGEPGGKAATPWVWCHTRGSKGFVGGWSFHVIRKKKEEKRKKKKEKRRGFLEADFETIADFLVKAAQCTSGVQREHEKSQKDFLKGLRNCKDIVELRNRVETFASQFAMPRFDI